MKLVLKNVRVAFPTLFEAKTVNGEGEPRFSATFIIPPTDPLVKEIAAAIQETAKAKWGEKAGAVLQDLVAKGRVCFSKLPKTNSSGEVYDGFEGNTWLSASNKTRPLILDRDKSQLTAADGRPYGGCYVNASIELWAQDNNFGRRINASLKGVQFVRDGDAFGGGAPASPDDFANLGTETEADPLFA